MSGVDLDAYRVTKVSTVIFFVFAKFPKIIFR